MKYVLIGLCLLILAGCENLRHKTFRTTGSVIGLKASMVDPSGSGSPAPQIVFGSLTNIITTVTPGVKLDATTEVGSMIHKTPALKDTLKVDSTQSGDIITTEKAVTYKK